MSKIIVEGTISHRSNSFIYILDGAGVVYSVDLRERRDLAKTDWVPGKQVFVQYKIVDHIVEVVNVYE